MEHSDGEKTTEPSNASLVAKAMGSVAKFKEMKPNWGAVATGSGEFQFPVYKYCDGAVPNMSVAVPAALLSNEFRLANGVCQPGQGAPMHNHTGEELMFAASGSWVVYFDEAEENKIFLEPWDAVLVPANLVRGWRNVGKEVGCLLNFSSISDQMTIIHKDAEPEVCGS